MKTILITGVTGFIGSHLAAELGGQHRVVGLVRRCAHRPLEQLQPFLGKISLVEGDITDYPSTLALLRRVNPDIVVHLAALSPVRDSFDKPFAYVRTNVHGTLNIAHGLLELPGFRNKRLLYASTAEVYGIQKRQPIPEEAALLPSSPYAVTKSMTDEYLRMMTTVYGLNTTVMRCVNSYGRKLDPSFYVEYLIVSMLKGETLYIGAPDSLRDYMYVSDHTAAYRAAIAHPGVRGEAFNVALGEVLSNRELALRLADRLGYSRKKIKFGKYPPGYPRRPIQSDQPFIDLDARKIRKVLGWKPRVRLEDGLTRVLEYWEQRINH
ncbi:MAG: GDP-mannose 4,6-dehydratase [Lentisphaerae bacterium]|nr:GDP-mannose 4,6-dehydratase [Lentisphaerota bacterium]